MADTATTGAAAAAQINEPLIRVEGLRKSFGSLEVLKGIDLKVVNTAGAVIKTTPHRQKEQITTWKTNPFTSTAPSGSTPN